nr:uncharacterized protein LOC102149798 [Equus caballus]
MDIIKGRPRRLHQAPAAGLPSAPPEGSFALPQVRLGRKTSSSSLCTSKTEKKSPAGLDPSSEAKPSFLGYAFRLLRRSGPYRSHSNLRSRDDAKINAPSLSGNGVVQPRQSFAVSGATRGRGSASEVTTCLGSIWPPASGTSISPGRGWTEPGWEREKKKKLAIVPRAPTVYEYKCLIYSSLQPAKEILSRFMETELQNGMEPAG